MWSAVNSLTFIYKVVSKFTPVTNITYEVKVKYFWSAYKYIDIGICSVSNINDLILNVLSLTPAKPVTYTTCALLISSSFTGIFKRVYCSPFFGMNPQLGGKSLTAPWELRYIYHLFISVSLLVILDSMYHGYCGFGLIYVNIDRLQLNMSTFYTRSLILVHAKVASQNLHQFPTNFRLK